MRSANCRVNPALIVIAVLIAPNQRQFSNFSLTSKGTRVLRGHVFQDAFEKFRWAKYQQDDNCHVSKVLFLHNFSKLFVSF